MSFTCAAIVLFLLFAAPAISAPSLSKVVDAAGESARKGAEAQALIDSADSEADALLRRFRDENRRIEDLRLYNRQLEIRIKDQNALIEQLKKLGRDAVEFEKRIPSLLLRMIESMEKFVELDIPFLRDERAKRVDSLKKLMARGDVTTAEQFRRVFDAYLDEIQYGNTIGAYEGVIELKGKSRRVTFLRIGRVALLYQTEDRSLEGMWSREKNRWVPLGGEYSDSIRRGISVAREQAAPGLMFVPVQAASGEGKN
ncbi:MAG: DUF3450 domain-containing protein [Thermodesulfobacteriota bacterium]